MKKIVVLTMLALPAAAFAQGEGRGLLGVDEPAVGQAPAEPEAPAAADEGEPAQRPDASRLMSEISAPLRLSSKQEERISSAVSKKAAEFDKRMKEFEKASAEERSWRFKMNEARHAMQKIDRDLPDTVRDYLDDEQREAYDALLAPKEKPARPEPSVAAAPAEEAAPKAVKKRRMVRRKKAPAAVRGAAPAAPGAEAPAAEEEGGQVMVDKESAPAPKKRRLVRRKKVPSAPAAKPAPAQEPAAEPAPEKPAAPAADQAAQDADGGYYP